MRLPALAPRRQRQKPMNVAISNPHSGKGTERFGMARAIGQTIATKYWHYEPATLEELGRIAGSIPSIDPDVITLVGGDGTISECLSGLLPNYLSKPNVTLPRFCIIPTGTQNNDADELGINRMPADEFARRIQRKIELHLPVDIKHLHALRLVSTLEDGSEVERYGFLFGGGFPFRILEEYYKLPPSRNPKWRIIKAFWPQFTGMLKSVFTRKRPKNDITLPVHAKIIMPEGHDPPVAPFMSHSGFLLSTISKVGMGCRAMPDATKVPGCLMLRSTQLTFKGLLLNFPSIALGGPMARTFDAIVPSVAIEYEQPTPRTMDGEILPPAVRDVVECGPLLPFIVG